MESTAPSRSPNRAPCATITTLEGTGSTMSAMRRPTPRAAAARLASMYPEGSTSTPMCRDLGDHHPDEGQHGNGGRDRQRTPGAGRGAGPRASALRPALTMWIGEEGGKRDPHSMAQNDCRSSSPASSIARARMGRERQRSSVSSSAVANVLTELLGQRPDHGGVGGAQAELGVEHKGAVVEVGRAHVGPAVDQQDFGVQHRRLVFEDPHAGLEKPAVAALPRPAHHLLATLGPLVSTRTSTPRRAASARAATNASPAAKYAVVSHSRFWAPAIAA